MKRFFCGTRILPIHRVVMTLIPRGIANFRQHPAQRLRPVIAVVKVDRIKMESEVAQLRQEHNPPLRPFSGQAFKPGEDVLFKRRAQRIIRIMERSGGNTIATDPDRGQRLQLIEIEPGHKDAVAELVRFRPEATMA